MSRKLEDEKNRFARKKHDFETRLHWSEFEVEEAKEQQAECQLKITEL